MLTQDDNQPREETLPKDERGSESTVSQTLNLSRSKTSTEALHQTEPHLYRLGINQLSLSFRLVFNGHWVLKLVGIK